MLLEANLWVPGAQPFSQLLDRLVEHAREAAAGTGDADE